MKTIKNSSLWEMMVLLIVAFSTSVAVSSCSKDKDDDPSSSSSFSLVGTWYYMEDNGDFDYDDFFVFKSNGSFNFTNEFNGTYKFNEQTSILSLKWREDDDDVEKIYVESFAKDIIYLEGWGVYKKK